MDVDQQVHVVRSAAKLDESAAPRGEDFAEGRFQIREQLRRQGFAPVWPEFGELGSHALQQTLRKLDLAFQAFFRRVKAGQTPGFPRFKASRRFSGFCYPDPAGWKLAQNGTRGATIRLGSGKDAMSIRARGRHRFGDGTKPNDLTVTRKNDAWLASVTLRVSEDACARARSGDAHRGVNFGLNDWATFDNGETIANPRFVRNEMPRMADLQRQQARKKRGSIRYKRLGKQFARCMSASSIFAASSCTRRRRAW